MFGMIYMGGRRATNLSRFIPLTSATNVIDMVSVVPGLAAARGNPAVDSNALINSYINANPGLRSNCVWHFRPGATFYHYVDIYQLGLQNVGIDAIPGTVEFQKLPGNSSTTREYSLFTKNSKGVYVQGIRWIGVTESLTALAFGGAGLNADSGLYFGSCEDTWVIGCELVNLADAAIRMTQSPDSVVVNDSRNGYVMYNTFINCTQVTTTPNGSVVGGVGKGGCNNFNVVGNKAYNLKGSFKAACRYPTEGALFENNLIECAPGVSTSCGIEILSFTNTQAVKNTIKYAQNWALHYYPNGESGLNMFQYGNATADGNILIDNKRGIRVNNAAFAGNGLQATPYNMNLFRNTVDGISYNDNSNPAAIVYSGGGWGSGQCKDNGLSRIANGVNINAPSPIVSAGNIYA